MAVENSRSYYTYMIDAAMKKYKLHPSRRERLERLYFKFCDNYAAKNCNCNMRVYLWVNMDRAAKKMAHCTDSPYDALLLDVYRERLPKCFTVNEEAKQTIDKWLQDLPERTRDFIHKYYGFTDLPMSCSEIGRLHGITDSRVWVIIDKSRRQLREVFAIG